MEDDTALYSVDNNHFLITQWCLRVRPAIPGIEEEYSKSNSWVAGDWRCWTRQWVDPYCILLQFLPSNMPQTIVMAQCLCQYCEQFSSFVKMSSFEPFGRIYWFKNEILLVIKIEFTIPSERTFHIVCWFTCSY